MTIELLKLTLGTRSVISAVIYLTTTVSSNVHSPFSPLFQGRLYSMDTLLMPFAGALKAHISVSVTTYYIVLVNDSGN